MNSNSKNKNPFWVSVGQRINTLLATSGKSQKELAEYLNIIPNTISYWTAGARTPNTEQIVKIAAFFECTSDYILGLSDVQSPDTDIQAICEYTGLNENVVNDLHEFYIEEKEPEERLMIDTLNKVLVTDEFFDIIQSLTFLSNTNNSVAYLSHIDIVNLAEKHNIDKDILVDKWLHAISYAFLSDEFIEYMISPKETECRYNNVRSIERLNNMFCKSDISTMTKDEIIKLFDEAAQKDKYHKHEPEPILTFKIDNTEIPRPNDEHSDGE